MEPPAWVRESGPNTKQSRRLTVFKMSAYDPFFIALMGFGILLAVALATIY
jgi:hypothetical protein